MSPVPEVPLCLDLSEARPLIRLRAACASAGAGVRITVMRDTVTTSILINAILQASDETEISYLKQMLARLFEINKVTVNS